MTIAELLNAKEGENVEFKEAKNSYEFDKLVKYACAVSKCIGDVLRVQGCWGSGENPECL